MIDKNLQISLTGDSSITHQTVKSKLNEYLTTMKLPITINESMVGDQINVQYRDEDLSFSKLSLNEDLERLYEMLVKINPKTGKICRCSDCKNCPSKRLEEQIIQDDKKVSQA